MGSWRRTVAHVALGLFVVSMLSGLLPVFVFHPSDAYGSVQKLSFLAPYGLFFRKLHYISSELFLLAVLGHSVLELGRTTVTISRASWLYSVMGAVAVVLLMFSGFVLKGDQSGSAAAQVALHLMHKTPLLDRLIPLVKDTEFFYHKFLVWHILFLPLILVWTIYKHIGRIVPRRAYWIVALGGSVLTGWWVAMPMDIAPTETVEHLRGPWFFWGAENLLEMDWPPWAVNAIVMFPFAMLLLYPFVRHQRWITVLLLLWIIAYGWVSIVR